ncbi:MAG: hypothetical protein IJT14_03360 [Rickettsiales bacterium]|nr:hypothetical protein [Rickettsiales bacterium]
MLPIIIFSCLAVVAVPGLIYFIYKICSKKSDKKTQLAIDNSVTAKEDQKKHTIDSPEINSAIDYLASLKVMGNKEQIVYLFKNFKNADDKTKNDYIKGIDGVINAQKTFIDVNSKHGLSDRVPLYNERLKNLNSLKQYLLSSK